VRVFVGTSTNGEDAEACAVFESTLRLNASVPVEITWLALSRDPASPLYSRPERDEGWRTDRWVTPWSAFRWAVPELCGWRGRAVYFDCPQIVMGDVAELGALRVPDGAVAAVRRWTTALRTSCIVWNCAAAERWLPTMDELRREPDHPQAVARLMLGRPSLTVQLPPGWAVNDVEYSDDPAGATGSVYCENLHMQPHVRHALSRLRRQGLEHWFDGARLPHYCERLVRLYDEALAEALASGYEPAAYVPAARPYETYAIRGVDGADLRRMAG
jgi:hypothetical protein